MGVVALLHGPCLDSLSSGCTSAVGIYAVEIVAYKCIFGPNSSRKRLYGRKKRERERVKTDLKCKGKEVLEGFVPKCSKVAFEQYSLSGPSLFSCSLEPKQLPQNCSLERRERSSSPADRIFCHQPAKDQFVSDKVCV